MNDGFRIKYTGHETRARKLLLQKGLKTPEAAIQDLKKQMEEKMQR